MSIGNFSFSIIFLNRYFSGIQLCNVVPNDVQIVMLFSGPPRDITQRPVYGGGRERGWEEGSRGGGR